MKSTLKLFRALPIKTHKTKVNTSLMEKTIKRGFIFSPEVIANYSNYSELITMVEDVIGLSAKKINSSFHKSWKKIIEADMEQLVVEQIAHYLTTYGTEQPAEYLIEKEAQWGVDKLAEKVSELDDIEMDRIQDTDYVYIPKEVLKIPDLKMDEIKLVIIRGYTHKELKEKLLKLLNFGIAFKEDTMEDILEVATIVDVNEKDIVKVKNKEAKAALYEYLGLFPENPIEFLRFAVYRATDSALLIKNQDLIDKIRENTSLSIVKIFSEYEKKYGLNRLAEIFYRFKPIFLAFRTHKKLKIMINKIRRLAVKNHKPMPEDYLNSITAKIKNKEKIVEKELVAELEKVNIFRKIRVAYALKFRTKDVESILYRIRNGKGYATDFSFTNKKEAARVLDIIVKSIVKDISKNVKGKKIYIPEYMNYSLPATEKQFTGQFPSGSFISIPKDMIFGIHWNNVNGNRIDLDLSVISPTVGKIGWDSEYRTEGRDILFSGDITDARKPNGASELFYVKRQSKKALIMFVNYYNFMEDVDVPFKILVAKEQPKIFKQNYMVDPNKILAIADSTINKRQKILGLFVSTTKENRFYFVETSIGQSITSYDSDFAEHSRKYLFSFYENTINLKDILVRAGATLTDDKDKIDIDLSPEALEKDSILNLLSQ